MVGIWPSGALGRMGLTRAQVTQPLCTMTPSRLTLPFGSIPRSPLSG
jgi:hypothetical protein